MAAAVLFAIFIVVFFQFIFIYFFKWKLSSPTICANGNDSHTHSQMFTSFVVVVGGGVDACAVLELA